MINMFTIVEFQLSHPKFDSNHDMYGMIQILVLDYISNSFAEKMSCCVCY